MFLPVRAKNPPESFPVVTILLILANVVVYALTTSDGLDVRPEVVDQWGLKGTNFGPLHIFTSMFLHGGLFHLLGNMWFLYIFGFSVEGRMKAWFFLPMYLASGVAGDVLHQAILGGSNPDIPSIGASGAIMGVLGAGLYMFPHAKVTIFYRFFVWGTTDWPLWGCGLYFLGIDALFAFLGASDGVGHFAHLGGAAGGFLIALILRMKRDSTEASDAKAMLSETKDLSVLAPYEFSAIAKNDRDNTLLAVHWIQRGFKSHGGPSRESLEYFNRLLPRVVQEQSPLVVGSTMLMLAMDPGKIPIPYLLRTAMQCEQAGDKRLALNLYEAALRDPEIAEGDRESAMFRSAIMVEHVFGDRQRAAEVYRQFLARYPMSAMADQAQTRIRNLTS